MLRLLRKLVDVIVQVGGWAILAAACLVTYDVVTRKLLNISIAGADEISGYVFAIASACAFSYALLSRANIRIDFLYNRLPSAAQRVLDIVSIAMTAGFLGVICFYAYDLAADAVRYGSRSITPLQTPLAIPQVMWFVALLLALFTAVVLTVAAVVALLRGQPERTAEIVGVPSLDEEIEIELSDRASGERGKD